MKPINRYGGKISWHSSQTELYNILHGIDNNLFNFFQNEAESFGNRFVKDTFLSTKSTIKDSSDLQFPPNLRFSWDITDLQFQQNLKFSWDITDLQFQQNLRFSWETPSFGWIRTRTLSLLYVSFLHKALPYFLPFSRAKITIEKYR